MFYFFIKACEKYDFDFSLSNNGIHSMYLMPKNTFESITIKRDYFDYNFNELFFKAIKIMRKYRMERGY